MVQKEEAMRIIIEFEKNRAWNKVPILRLILSIFKGVKIGFVWYGSVNNAEISV